MDSRLKQRLIGAFVIVLLAVIFVPYLLENSSKPSKPVAENAMPPAPESEAPNGQGVTFSLPSTEQSPPSTSETASSTAAPAASPQQPDKTAMLETSPSATESIPPEPAEQEPSSTESAPFSPQPQITTVDVSKPEAPTPPPAVPSKPAPAVPERQTRTPPKETPPKVELIGRTTTPVKEAKPAPTRTESTPSKRPPSSPPEKPAPVAKATPSRDVALPKVELIGRSMSTASSTSTAPTQVATAQTPSQQSSSGRWIVQVGSFSLQQNANNLRNQLRSNNFNASVEPVSISGQTMYRVRVGPQRSRGESEQVLTRLRQAGIGNGQIISLNN
ncbi:MAG: SPOR domain-containing protein [Gammaproteobacteria bacterium]|nr:SPOR domain-containing protein [Gammaproteobacteria bacterium]MCP5424801.1 SPOR domain-containing protein [Gammaproteobacteria bacterium]MCP5458222.1 SPOR domain-containing protein [Gammaproteobacteria bacterium]